MRGVRRIHEYKPVMDKMMGVDECIRAVEESGAPIVSIAGGEPTIHPKIDEIINELVRRKFVVYCCTNGLLLERVMKKVPPSNTSRGSSTWTAWRKSTTRLSPARASSRGPSRP